MPTQTPGCRLFGVQSQTRLVHIPRNRRLRWSILDGRHGTCCWSCRRRCLSQSNPICRCCYHHHTQNTSGTTWRHDSGTCKSPSRERTQLSIVSRYTRRTLDARHRGESSLLQRSSYIRVPTVSITSSGECPNDGSRFC